MLDEVRSHQDAGRPAFIVSAAGNGVVELLARVLDMEGGIGTRYEVDAEGRYTGGLTAPQLRRAARSSRCGASPPSTASTSTASWAYSDSASDLPMLELVGHPVAVNPTPSCSRRRERGWQVMRFEKLGRRIARPAPLAVAALVGGGSASAARPRRARALDRPRARRRSRLNRIAAMDAAELAFAGIARQAELLRDGEVRSRELVAIYLERIERFDRKLNAFRVVLAERALAEAAEADRRIAAGESAPLLGVPIAVKDNVDVAGELTTQRHRAASTEPAEADSAHYGACARRARC